MASNKESKQRKEGKQAHGIAVSTRSRSPRMNFSLILGQAKKKRRPRLQAALLPGCVINDK